MTCLSGFRSVRYSFTSETHDALIAVSSSQRRHCVVVTVVMGLIFVADDAEESSRYVLAVDAAQLILSERGDGAVVRRTGTRRV